MMWVYEQVLPRWVCEPFWKAPDGAGNITALTVVDGKVHAECEGGIYEILPDGTSVGVTYDKD